MQNLLRILNRLRHKNPLNRDLPNPAHTDRMQSLMNCLEQTLDSEVDCMQFDIQMDCIAEALAEGRSTAEILTPEFEAHLRHSNDCEEEFNALIAILKAEEAGELKNI